MAEFLLNNIWVGWLIIALAFLVLEAVTSSLVSIWFVPGAVITSIMSIWVKNIPAQIIVFVVLSALFLCLCRKYFAKTKSETLDDTNDRLIGKTAKAETDIKGSEGKVLIGDVYWRAVSDSDINEGETVIITSVSGNLITVEKK